MHIIGESMGNYRNPKVSGGAALTPGRCASTHVIATREPVAPSVVLLIPKEAAIVLKVSLSWLAKARMRGDGPPYIRIGRSIRYPEADLLQWIKSRQRLSTIQQSVWV